MKKKQQSDKVYIKDCYEQLKPHIGHQQPRRGFVMTLSGTIEPIPETMDEREAFFEANMNP